MSKQKTTVTVELEVEIEFDPEKFTPEFQHDFKRHFFNHNTIRDHLEHLATIAALGGSSPQWDSDTKSFRTFIEGYGFLDDMGINLGDADVIDVDFSDEDGFNSVLSTSGGSE